MAEGRVLFNSARAAVWCGGVLSGDAAASVTGVDVDSRRCTEGTLFVALKGEHVDGHDYIDAAFRQGAVGVITSKDRSVTPEPGRFVISVEDPLGALQQISAEYLGTVNAPVRIGVTGSNGKTTTKELIAGVLAEQYSVVKTEGNFNSEIGLPLSVFKINDSYDYAVIEMGINRVGEMDVLAEILRPDMVVITNIGTAHIGIFETIEKIAFEKRRSVSRFSGDGTLFVPEDEVFADFLSDGLEGRLVRYGRGVVEDAVGGLSWSSAGLRGWEFELNGEKKLFRLSGEHNLRNAFCAAAVGLFCGLSDVQILSGLAKAEPLFGRSEIIEGPVTIIQDCYNANGDSMLSSIEFADSLEWSGNKCYVLGDMKELGDNSRNIHTEAGAAAARSRASRVFFFGEDSAYAFGKASELLAESGASSPLLHHTEDYDELEHELLAAVEEGDLILLKGSRTMSLERLVAPVEEKFRRAEC